MARIADSTQIRDANMKIVKNMYIFEFYGDSDETKPTVVIDGNKNLQIADGSTFTETDTGDTYIYNEKSASWVKWGEDDG